MDDLDFQLLGALSRDPLASHEALARTIERSPSAVRKRLDALAATGVLEGFVAVPAPGALDLRGVAASWQIRVAADRFLGIPGTVWAGTTIDGNSGALAYVPQPGRWIEEARRTTGSEPTEVFDVRPYEGPPLGPLDLRVLRALVDAPRADAVELARRCGLSPKTVRARRAGMMTSGAVRIEPVIHGERSGAITFHVSTTCARNRLPAVMDALEEVVPLGGVGPAQCLLVRASTLAEKARRLEAVRALGVDFGEVLMNDDFTWNLTALGTLVDEALARWRAASHPRSPPEGVQGAFREPGPESV